MFKFNFQIKKRQTYVIQKQKTITTNKNTICAKQT